MGGLAGVVAITIVGLFLFPRLIKRQQPVDTTDTFVVAATIFPLVDIVRNVAGTTTEVVQLVPSNADPHSYTPSPQLIAQAQRADVLFIIGHGLDDHIARALTNVVTVPVVVVDDAITLREFSETHQHEEAESSVEAAHVQEVGSRDPHYWLTVPNAQVITTTVARELSRRNPAGQREYAAQAERYRAELTTLEETLQKISSSLTQRHFIAMHNAWSYFAEQYNLELVGTYEPVEGHTPSFKDLQHIGEEIKTHAIHVFYAEPQKASTAATKFFAQEFDLRILTLNAEGALRPEYSYIELMRDNLQAIAAGE